MNPLALLDFGLSAGNRVVRMDDCSWLYRLEVITHPSNLRYISDTLPKARVLNSQDACWLELVVWLMGATSHFNFTCFWLNAWSKKMFGCVGLAGNFWRELSDTSNRAQVRSSTDGGSRCHVQPGWIQPWWRTEDYRGGQSCRLMVGGGAQWVSAAVGGRRHGSTAGVYMDNGRRASTWSSTWYGRLHT